MYFLDLRRQEFFYTPNATTYVQANIIRAGFSQPNDACWRILDCCGWTNMLIKRMRLSIIPLPVGHYSWFPICDTIWEPCTDLTHTRRAHKQVSQKAYERHTCAPCTMPQRQAGLLSTSRGNMRILKPSKIHAGCGLASSAKYCSATCAQV